MITSKKYKNIILDGCSGSLGSVLLGGLLSEPQLDVTILARESPKSRDQDVVVNALTSTSVHEQFRFIEASIEARVKPCMPSEYGLNNLHPRARQLSPVFNDKGAVQGYLKSKESTGLMWTAIACRMWISWSLKHEFLGLHPKDRKIVLTDEGEGLFFTTTMSNTVLALNRALLNPEKTANKFLYISDFATSQKELLLAIERITGEKWSMESVSSKQVIKDAKERYANGDLYDVYPLIEMGFTTGRYGGNLEAEGELANEMLELPKTTLDEVVKEAMEEVRN